jgi:hypothetical protein
LSQKEHAGRIGYQQVTAAGGAVGREANVAVGGAGREANVAVGEQQVNKQTYL